MKLDSSKKFYRIGGMSIVIKVWLYVCSSSIDFQVAQKVDDHIPRLLSWQTAEMKLRYKKLMNAIFSDVNNKFKFRNITPNPRELAVLQLSSEGIENQGKGQYSDSSDDDLDDVISYDKNSDDDFQEPPPPIVKDKKRKSSMVKDHYKKNRANIPVAMNFGVVLIDNKNWFYNLSFKGHLLNNSVRIIYLYLS
ncbi:hypothetical protein H5410_041605 [Solanum commersonii]|uniref:Uncharacterized protein n=1 Tax=Solanum commersonii TaxID=4109 RepID=A0A9J5XS20_SOLCO|nr:hypothetical protein H5410_041605 [Solanum commersonii]